MLRIETMSIDRISCPTLECDPTFNNRKVRLRELARRRLRLQTTRLGTLAGTVPLPIKCIPSRNPLLGKFPAISDSPSGSLMAAASFDAGPRSRFLNLGSTRTRGQKTSNKCFSANRSAKQATEGLRLNGPMSVRGALFMDVMGRLMVPMAQWLRCRTSDAGV